MGFWARLFGKGESANMVAEHSVILCMKLSDGEFGTAEEGEGVFELEGRLAGALEDSGTGEFDGDEFEQGQCRLFMYGPDADRLFETVEDVVRSSEIAKGGYVIKKYGQTTDKDAPEVRVEL